MGIGLTIATNDFDLCLLSC
ncbi:hypothetical protein [Chitinophaga agri]